jgi:hypothetical protein
MSGEHMTRETTVLRTLDLPGGGMVPFPAVPGEQVRILYGRVWLTEEGGGSDAFLASGEEIRLAQRGLAVIEALGPARVELIEPVIGPSLLAQAGQRVAQRLGAWLRQKRPALALEAQLSPSRRTSSAVGSN